MPDANGNFKGFGPTRKTAEAWQRIFGIPVVTDERMPPGVIAFVSTAIESTEAECCGVYGWCDKHDNQKRESASATP